MSDSVVLFLPLPFTALSLSLFFFFYLFFTFLSLPLFLSSILLYSPLVSLIFLLPFLSPFFPLFPVLFPLSSGPIPLNPLLPFPFPVSFPILFFSLFCSFLFLLSSSWPGVFQYYHYMFQGHSGVISLFYHWSDLGGMVILTSFFLFFC